MIALANNNKVNLAMDQRVSKEEYQSDKTLNANSIFNSWKYHSSDLYSQGKSVILFSVYACVTPHSVLKIIE